MTIYTIGYEGSGLEAFLACLKENNIELLADVRERPISRKPGFSKTKLAEKVGELGLRYEHFPRLGCPAAIRNAYRADNDWEKYCDDFGRYLKANLDAVDELARFLNTSRCALMCFEADPHRCHRLLVAKEIEMRYHTAIINLQPADNS